jgi:hypothetical protein
MRAPSQDTNVLNRCPSLRAYVERVRATVKNFKRYLVEEEDEDGYKKVSATIAIKDGTIVCDTEESAPTAVEISAIEAEIASAQFPRSIRARRICLPDQLIGVDPKDYCVFLDPTGEETPFIHQRVEREDGKKTYLPWSFWSDGIWRMMEPDGLLPLYGLDRLKNTTMAVMLHEGAKAARDVQAMVDAGRDHPWMTDLREYVHLGWPGGGDAARRVDWKPVLKLQPEVRVVLVCDRDVKGENVTSPISSILRRTMMALMFDDRFGTTFDLADPWPQRKEWWQGKRYRGPRLDDCLFPATWATETVKAEGSDKPVHKIRNQFAAEWLWVEEPDAFVHRHQVDRLRSRTTFNSRIRSFSDVDDTARLFVRSFSSICDGVVYRPGEGPGIIHEDGRRLINTFRPSAIAAVEGDPAPFLELMEYMFPIETDRREVMRWMATLIACPDVRMRYSLLLISEIQGVGKTTLGQDILVPLVGAHNASVPSEQTIVDSSFDSWIAHKRLAVIHEIYSGDSKKGYNRLKDKIADTSITVNRKYLEAYNIENYLHAVACSNSVRAIHLDDADRRWLVPRVVEELRDKKKWDAFHHWRKGDGLGIIRGYLEKLAADPGFVVGTGDHAPLTSMKQEVINESRSVGQQLAYDLGIAAMKAQQEVILTVEEVRRWVAEKRRMDLSDPKLEKPRTLKRVMMAAGMKEPKTAPEEMRKRYKVGIDENGKRDYIKTYVVANFEIAEGIEWDAVKEHHKLPENVWPL